MPKSLVAEAQTLRDLGRYPGALKKYREAQNEQDGLVLRTEIASMFLEQGLAGKCHKEIDDFQGLFDNAETDAKALAKMLSFASAAATTVQFTTNIKGAADLYDSHLVGKKPVAYTRVHVSL